MKCFVPGCDRTSSRDGSRGGQTICPAHYQQKRAGKPFTKIKPRRARSVAHGTYRNNKAQYLRDWRRKHPESAALDRLRRRGEHSIVVQEIDRDLLYDVFNESCYLCGIWVDRDNWELEHIQPLSRGGQHTYHNVAVSCMTCNRRKNDKTLIELFTGGNSD